MKKLMIGAMALTAGIILTGCGDSAPECGSDDVKTSVIASFKAKLDQERKLTSGIQAQEKIIADYKNELNKLDQSDKNYEANKKYKEDSIKRYENSIKEKQYYLDILNSSEISLIRTDATDDKSKKSTCSAVINISKPMWFMAPYTTYDIAYTAYITSDGKLFTEVNKSELNRKGEMYQYPESK